MYQHSISLLDDIEHDVAEQNNITPAGTTRRLRNQFTFRINNPVQAIQETGSTHSNRVKKEKHAAKRRTECTMPMLVPLCDKDGNPASGKNVTFVTE